MIRETDELTFTVDVERRLDLLIQGAFFEFLQKEVSRSEVQRWIEQHCVTVNEKLEARTGTKPKIGSLVHVKVKLSAPTTVDAEEGDIEVIFEDKDLLVINKEPGISVHPGAGQRSGTLANRIVHYLRGAGIGEVPRWGLVHRLDKDTTGVLVVCKNAESHFKVSRMFHDREVNKRYISLVYCPPRGAVGIRSEDSGTIDLSIGRDPKFRVRMKVDGEAPRSAITHFEVIERFRYAALLKAKIDTGRTHQIRVHMAHIGSPVIGDVTYWGQQKLPVDLADAVKRFSRQALHAHSLQLKHPTTGEVMTFEAQPPKDFQSLVGVFRGKTQ